MRNRLESRSARVTHLLIVGAAILLPFNALCATGFPSISGTAANTVVAGHTYEFQPSATGANGATLVFSVTDKPVWARLDRSTGRFWGTPTLTQAGVYGAIEISVSDGTTRTKLPKFAITVTPGTLAGSHVPVISGTAPPTVVAGHGYSFQPTASDSPGNQLVFSITSRPEWATLDKATGRLTGIPTNAQAGSYEEIEISVSDGSVRAQLPKFTITVTPGAPVDQSITVAWVAPSLNTDGTALTNLGGYRIVYGSQPGKYTNSINLTAGLSIYQLDNLPPGTYYLAMMARTTDGVESAPSGEVSVTLT